MEAVAEDNVSGEEESQNVNVALFVILLHFCCNGL